MTHAARAALLVLLALAIGGLARWWRLPAAADGSGDLRIAFTNGLLSLDPRIPRFPSSLAQRVIDTLWDNLLVLDPESLETRPGAAVSWASSVDGRQITLKLRDGLRWSNGDTVTAEDFVRTVEWLSRERSDYQLVQLLARPRPPGAPAAARELLVSARDASTLEISLSQPRADMLARLAAAGWPPTHVSTDEAFRGDSWKTPGRLVTSGPYRLRSFSRHDIVLERNPHYASARAGSPDAIRLIRTEGPSCYASLVAAGRADLAEEVNVQRTILRWVPDGARIAHETTASISIIQFNPSRPPLDDARVRQALSLALDRAALAEAFFGDGALPAYSFTPPGQTKEPALRTVTEDLALAKRLMAEAGYPDGEGMPVLRFPVVIGEGSTNPLAYYCADQWRERLGVTIYVVPLEREEMMMRTERGDFDFVHYRWAAQPFDVSLLPLQLTGGLPAPFNAWSSDRARAELRRAQSLKGPERREAMRAAEQTLVDQVPATPAVLYNRYTLISDRVAGWEPDIFGRHPLRALSRVDRTAGATP